MLDDSIGGSSTEASGSHHCTIRNVVDGYAEATDGHANVQGDGGALHGGTMCGSTGTQDGGGGLHGDGDVTNNSQVSHEGANHLEK